MNMMEKPGSKDQTVHFCGCILNNATQTIETEHGLVRLRSKLWNVLMALIEHSNRLVLRESLVEDVWRGNNYTGEKGLTHTICQLRSILKKMSIPVKIITFPKKGYVLESKENFKESRLAQSLDTDLEHLFKSENFSNHSTFEVNIQNFVQYQR